MKRSMMLGAALAAMTVFVLSDTLLAQQGRGRGRGGQYAGQRGGGMGGMRGGGMRGGMQGGVRGGGMQGGMQGSMSRKGRGQRQGSRNFGNQRGSQQARGRTGQRSYSRSSDATSGALSEAAANELIYMREEEKLAHDVYQALAEKWDDPVFRNILAAESRHTQAIANLLKKYDLEDPVTDSTPGVFQNPELAKLYDQLVEQGSRSLTDAYKVGALIEELDISDLRKAKQTTQLPDVLRVYDALERGSDNHLRAFANQLKKNDESYQAKYLPQSEFDAIASGAIQRGNRRQGNSSYRGKGRGGMGQGMGQQGQRGRRGGGGGRGQGRGAMGMNGGMGGGMSGFQSGGGNRGGRGRGMRRGGRR